MRTRSCTPTTPSWSRSYVWNAHIALFSAVPRGPRVMHAASHSSASSLPSPSTSKVATMRRASGFSRRPGCHLASAHGDADGGVGVIARRVLAQGLTVRLLNRAHLGAGRVLGVAARIRSTRRSSWGSHGCVSSSESIVRHGVDPAAVVRGDVVLEDGPGGDGTSRRRTLLRRRAIVAVVGEAGGAAAHVVDRRRVEVMIR